MRDDSEEGERMAEIEVSDFCFSGEGGEGTEEGLTSREEDDGARINDGMEGEEADDDVEVEDVA